MEEEQDLSVTTEQIASDLEDEIEDEIEEEIEQIACDLLKTNARSFEQKQQQPVPSPKVLLEQKQQGAGASPEQGAGASPEPKKKRAYKVSQKVLDTRKRTGHEHSVLTKKAVLFDKFLAGRLTRDEILLAGFPMAPPPKEPETIVVVKDVAVPKKKEPGPIEFMNWFS